MEKTVYVVTDLGTGDGGKGGVVHGIAAFREAHTVIKVGGAQGSHGVKTAAGQSFAFSQFGCGTFEGAKTFISRNFVLRPNDLLNEARFLALEHGVIDPHHLVTIDGRALCATPFHLYASRLLELARKSDNRGTAGSGVGNAVADSWARPDLAIYAADLSHPSLLDKIEAVRRQKLVDLAEIIEGNDFLETDRVVAAEAIGRLREEGYSTWTAKRFQEMSALIKVVPDDYLASEVLAPDGYVVVEASHGILTDRYHGFHPHTSKLRTLPGRTADMLLEAGYDGAITQLGIFRAYGIRHGAGPFVTEDPSLLEHLLPGSHKDANRWQGAPRVGALDLVALRYAIEVCGGPSAFGGLCVTWFDQIVANGKWPTCTSYEGAADREFFASDRQILVRRGEDEAQLEHQRRLGQKLNACRPNVETLDVPSENHAEFCAAVVGEKLGVPVRMVSLGPTEDDKVFL